MNRIDNIPLSQMYLFSLQSLFERGKYQWSHPPTHTHISECKEIKIKAKEQTSNGSGWDPNTPQMGPGAQDSGNLAVGVTGVPFLPSIHPSDH